MNRATLNEDGPTSNQLIDPSKSGNDDLGRPDAGILPRIHASIATLTCSGDAVRYQPSLGNTRPRNGLTCPEYTDDLLRAPGDKPAGWPTVQNTGDHVEGTDLCGSSGQHHVVIAKLVPEAAPWDSFISNSGIRQ